MISKSGFLTVAKIPKERIEKAGIYLCNGQTPLQWYNAQTKKPFLVVNCSFFYWGTKGMAPIYTLKIDGRYLIKDSLFEGIGIFENTLRVAHCDNIQSDDFVSGVPVIMQNGSNKLTQGVANMLSTINGKHPRTILGYDGENAIVMTADGRQAGKAGLTLEELYPACLSVGMTNAINLDGGGSTCMVVNGKIENSPSENRGVYSVFAIWLKEDIMEWKQPSFTWVILPYVQATKDGTIKSQNGDYKVALESAQRNNWALWEKSTKKRLWPVEATQPTTPQPTTNKEQEYLNLLRKIKSDIEKTI
ncbi:MAG TPA: phosphodiester glycosidase family protein [bacterium]|nr:phosphodiester glycosidase family protein [bacterium]